MILEIISLSMIVYLITTGATPIQMMKKSVKLDNDSILTNKWYSLLRELVNCSMCTGFWIGFIYGIIFYKTWILSGIISLTSMILTIYLNKNNNTI